MCQTRNVIDPTMPLATVFFLLYISTSIDCSIFVYNSEDSSSVQFYDCVFHVNTPYCRRPSQPITLQREKEPYLCHHSGTNHSFRSLRSANVTVHTVLQYWRSTIEKADQYARYIRQPMDANEGDKRLCQCANPQAFGKNCEYRLPLGNTFTDVVNAKFSVASGKLMYAGEIVCYSTLKCDFGLLCLDWRDICDGLQQCMFGLDEENCDKLEFNECEEDEYRCMNGMCIPDEYFLDGEYDCMDMSDEKGPFDDGKCPYQPANMECDDRVCPPNGWSCGDGQCIIERSLAGTGQNFFISCFNLRDQFFWCDHVENENLLTRENGRCSDTMPDMPGSIKNYCVHLLFCAKSWWNNKHCPCQKNKGKCIELYEKSCPYGLLRYPDGGLMAPYDFRYYNVTRTLSYLSHSPVYVLNGTIKCRGYLADFTYKASETFIHTFTTNIESFSCGLALRKVEGEGYHRHCHNDSRTFSNRSYHWIDVCNTSSQCISAYRINDGIVNCREGEDEKHGYELVSKSCSRIQQHRFRCSISQPICLPASTLGDLPNQCAATVHELSRGIQIGALRARCNSQLKTDCAFLRQLVEASWNQTLYNYIGLQRTHMKKVPFRSFCDTFQDSASGQDENATLCQSLWVCLREEWQCYTGHCIDIEWVLDGEWDCPDGSDEETMFAVGFNQSHPNRKWLNSTPFVNQFMRQGRYSRLVQLCNASREYGCRTREMLYSHNCTGQCAGSPSTKNSLTGCVSEYDKDDVFTYCFWTLNIIAPPFACPSTNVSDINSFAFRRRCSISLSQTDVPNAVENRNQAPLKRDVTCWDGQIIKKGGCDKIPFCPNREDEFLCGQEMFQETNYRAEKQRQTRLKEKKVKLRRFPVHADASEPANRSTAATVTQSTSSARIVPLPSNLSSLFNWCNRGIPIWTHNQSFVCFCPPQYHGDQCQLHSDRITFLTHVNYTHSNFAASTDTSIFHKFLVLLISHEKLISRDEFNVRPATEVLNHRKRTIYLFYSRSPEDVKKKQERYFNRSNIISEQPFSIRIEAYEMKLNLRPRRFAVWQYPIYFDYLPVHRLAPVLRFIPRTPDDLDPCLNVTCGKNAECYRVQNQRTDHLCLCKSGYFGENCSHSDAKCGNGYCSSNAVCLSQNKGLMNGDEWPLCVCPLDRIGQRCELSLEKCSENPCQNSGRCSPSLQPNEYSCQCTEEYQGKSCEKTKPSIHLQLHHNVTVAYQAVVVQYLKIDFVSLELNIVGQRVFSEVPNTFRYFHDTPTVPEIVLLKLYDSERSDIYILSLLTNQTSIRATTTITELNRCQSTQPFLVTHQNSAIKYHHVCRTHHELVCFFDDIYLCICEENHSRAECFNYDHSNDKCHQCLANGRCLKGRNDSDFHCICPACHTGRSCQFSFDSFSFTLDQLFFADLLSPNSLIRHATYYSLIIAPLLLFLLGFFNNTCCFVTFRRPRCLRNGIGHYLYAMSICNQLNLAFLALRLIHLTLNISSTYSSPALDNTLCKASIYLLATSTRLTYWLGSLVTIERVYVALFVNGQWLKTPRIARRIIALAVMTVLTVSAYQLVFVHSRISSDDGKNAMCTITFLTDKQIWSKLHSAMTVIDSVGPFLINLVCIVSIICLVTKKKMNATRGRDTHSPQSNVAPRQNRLHLLRTVLAENKELVIGPAFTLLPQLFSLPYFIASLTLRCQNLQGSGLRYLLTGSYFTTFIPPLTSFFLYISPSTFYSQEWRATKLAKWLMTFKQRRQDPPTTMITNRTVART